MIRITIAAPEAMIADANQLARCIGYSAADGETFAAADHEDGAGNRYAVASGLVQPAFIEDAQAPLAEPDWGADMAAAARAQAAITILDPEAPEPAVPDRITAVVGPEADAAREMMGLVRSV